MQALAFLFSYIQSSDTEVSVLDCALFQIGFVLQTIYRSLCGGSNWSLPFKVYSFQTPPFNTT